jgi:hypothetical protein
MSSQSWRWSLALAPAHPESSIDTFRTSSLCETRPSSSSGQSTGLRLSGRKECAMAAKMGSRWTGSMSRFMCESRTFSRAMSARPHWSTAIGYQSAQKPGNGTTRWTAAVTSIFSAGAVGNSVRLLTSGHRRGVSRLDGTERFPQRVRFDVAKHITVLRALLHGHADKRRAEIRDRNSRPRSRTGLTPEALFSEPERMPDQTSCLRRNAT